MEIKQARHLAHLVDDMRLLEDARMTLQQDGAAVIVHLPQSMREAVLNLVIQEIEAKQAEIDKF